MSRVVTTTSAMMRRMIAATRKVETQNGRLTTDETFLDPNRIVVKNVSAFTIPEFGLMQVKEALNEGERKVVEVDRPFDSTLPDTVWLLNGPFPIEPDGFGTAQSGPEYRVKTDTTYPIGTRLGWKENSFLAIPGLLFTVIGTDDITTNVARVMPDVSMVEIVRVTSNIKDSDGYYPGEVQRFDVTAKTWSTVRTCRVRDVNA